MLSAKELEDSEQLPPEVTTLTVLPREPPPPITTEEFLESLAFCGYDHWDDSLQIDWLTFDGYSSFPVTKDERFEWFRNFRKMKHTAFTVEHFLTSLNVWFHESSGDDEQEVSGAALSLSIPVPGP